MGALSPHPAMGRCVVCWTPFQDFCAGSVPDSVKNLVGASLEKPEIPPERAKKSVGASPATPSKDPLEVIFENMRGYEAAVELTWVKQNVHKEPPQLDMGGEELVSESLYPQVGPGGPPCRFGGSPRGVEPPRLQTRGVPTQKRHPAGWGNPG